MIEKLDSPFGTAVLSLLRDPDACLKVFEDTSLFGCLHPAGSGNEEDRQKLTALFMTTNLVFLDMSMLIPFGLDKIMQVLSFEAGRRYEREQIGRNELEKLFTKE